MTENTIQAVQGAADTMEAQDTPEVNETPIAERGEEGATPEQALENEKKTLPQEDRKRLQKALSHVARREEHVLQQQRTLQHQQKEFESRMDVMERRLQQAHDRERKIQALYDSPDVIHAFREAGLDFPKLVERVASHGSPESLVRHESSRLEQKLTALESQLEEERKLRAKREEGELTSRQQKEIDDGREWVSNQIQESWERFPNLATFPPQIIALQIENEAERYFREKGKYPNLDVLATRVENHIRQLDEKRTERRNSFKPAVPPSDAPLPDQGTASNGPPASRVTQAPNAGGLDAETMRVIEATRNRHTNGSFAKRATTISNKDASSRASTAKKPTDRASLRRHLMAKHGL